MDHRHTQEARLQVHPFGQPGPIASAWIIAPQCRFITRRAFCCASAACLAATSVDRSTCRRRRESPETRLHESAAFARYPTQAWCRASCKLQAGWFPVRLRCMLQRWSGRSHAAWSRVPLCRTCSVGAVGRRVVRAQRAVEAADLAVRYGERMVVRLCGHTAQ
jgi:hypothetical protein